MPWIHSGNGYRRPSEHRKSHSLQPVFMSRFVCNSLIAGSRSVRSIHMGARLKKTYLVLYLHWYHVVTRSCRHSCCAGPCHVLALVHRWYKTVWPGRLLLATVFLYLRLQMTFALFHPNLHTSRFLPSSSIPRLPKQFALWFLQQE